MFAPEYSPLLILVFLFVTGLVALVWIVLKLYRTIREDHPPAPRENEQKKSSRWQAETDSKLIENSIHTGPGSGYSNTTSIPKDPQEYAKIFVPDGAKKPR